MTFAATCAWSLLRSLVIAAVGLGVASLLRRALSATSARRTFWLWTCTLLPVFVPGLLIGYGYRNFALSLVHRPVWNELLYSLLITLQVVPVGTLILFASPPPPVSASALHVGRLVWSRPTAPRMLRASGVSELWIRHRFFSLLPAGAVLFLLAFQESEIATLMQVHTWTEWLFTRFVGGLHVTAMLKALLIPLLIQMAVVGLAFWIVAASTGTRAGSVPPSQGVRGAGAWLVFGYLTLAGIVVVGIPGGLVLHGAWEGFGVLRAHLTLLEEIGLAIVMSVAAGGLTWVLSGWAPSTPHRWKSILAAALLLPGLMGALSLGLSVAALVGRGPLVRIRDTPLPLVLSEVWFLLPRAVLLRMLIGGWRSSSPVHLARLLSQAGDMTRPRRASAILWRLDVGPRWGGLLLICYWAYIELTLPSLLAPPGMTPAPVVLYNLMHYGQISGLSAMLFATMAVPVVLIVVGWWGYRALMRLAKS